MNSINPTKFQSSKVYNLQAMIIFILFGIGTVHKLLLRQWNFVTLTYYLLSFFSIINCYILCFSIIDGSIG